MQVATVRFTLQQTFSSIKQGSSLVFAGQLLSSGQFFVSQHFISSIYFYLFFRHFREIAGGVKFDYFCYLNIGGT